MKLFELLNEGYKEVTQKFSQEAEPEQVDQAIATFKDLVQRNQVTGNERNIDWWGKQGWEPFVAFVNEKSQLKSMTQIKRSKNEGNAHVLYEDANWLVVVPLDKDASCFHGKHTDWCTTKPFESHFENYFYDEQVTLIYFLQVGTGNKWAISTHPEGTEYFDKNDNPLTDMQFQSQTGLDPQKFIQMVAPGTQAHTKTGKARSTYVDIVAKIAEMINALPAGTRNETIEKLIFQTKNRDNLKEYIEKTGKADYPKYFQKFMVSYDEYTIEYIENPSEEMQLAAVHQDGLAIKYIENPSEEVQLAAVHQDGYAAIKYIPNPSEKVQLAAVKQNGFAIQYIDNPSGEMQLTAIEQNGYAIQYIDNPSGEMQLTAIEQNGDVIRFIKNPSEEIQLAAIKQDGWVIRFIKNPSEEMQLAAVNRYGYAIRFIKNPSEEIQLAAVKQNGDAIHYIKNPSERVQLAAVKQNGWVIQYIDNPSEEIELAAVRQDGYAIQFIKNPSEEVQLVAVEQDGYAIQFIKNPSEKIQLAAVKKNAWAIKYIKNPSDAVKRTAGVTS